MSSANGEELALRSHARLLPLAAGGVDFGSPMPGVTRGLGGGALSKPLNKLPVELSGVNGTIRLLLLPRPTLPLGESRPSLPLE